MNACSVKKAVIGLALGLLCSPLFGYEVSVDTVVANPGLRVAVPVRLDTVKGASYAGVRVTYDPQVLVFMKAQEGTLAKVLSDDYVVWGDEKGGAVSVTAFAKGDVSENVGGTLTTLIFEVRDGTEGLYSDLAVADVQIGERTGVKDLTVDNSIRTKGGMVRVMSTSASVARLENEQFIGADVTLGVLALKAGDGIQASGNQTPIVVSGTVASDGAIAVMPPVDGWASGRYELLKTSTVGLTLALADAPDGTTLGSETAAGVTTYYADVAVVGEVEIICGDEMLSAAAKSQIRQAMEAAGVALADVKRIEVNGPAGSVAIIADLGIAPAVAGAVDANGILNVTYSMPTITITAFDQQTGVVRIKVVPGAGNKIVSELATGYVHVYGTSNLAEKMKYISKVGFDLTPYLKSDTKGEAVLQVELGSHSFLKVKVESVEKAEGATE